MEKRLGRQFGSQLNCFFTSAFFQFMRRKYEGTYYRNCSLLKIGIEHSFRYNLQKHVHLIEQALVFGARFHDIDPRRLDAGMAKQVSQLRDIFFDIIEGTREQVPQVVGEHFPRGYFGPLTQRLEQFPDRDTAEGLTCPGQEYRSVVDAVFLAPLLQPVTKLGGK